MERQKSKKEAILNQATLNKINNKTMKKGTVKFFNTQKNFGFITMEETGEQIFVHQSGLKTTINENDKVIFEVEESPKGLRAINVKIDV